MKIIVATFYLRKSRKVKTINIQHLTVLRLLIEIVLHKTDSTSLYLIDSLSALFIYLPIA